METLLLVSAIAWVITGVNLLFTYDKEPRPELRRIQEA